MPDNVVPIRDKLPPAALAERSDDELVRLVRGGLAPAFSVLVARHSDRLVNFCAKMTGQLRLGEDIAQDTWLAVHRALGGYQARGKFTSYLFTVAGNRCRNAHRTKQPDSFFEGEQDRIENPTPDQVDQLLFREQQNELYQHVATLKYKLRQAIVLRFAMDLEYDEIATITNRSESTMRSRVFHGLKALRKQLAGAAS